MCDKDEDVINEHLYGLSRQTKDSNGGHASHQVCSHDGIASIVVVGLRPYADPVAEASPGFVGETAAVATNTVSAGA